MKRAAAQALVERNAAACEAARHRVCRCACAGKLHGIAHSAEWQGEQVDKIADPETTDAQQGALDLHTWGAALAPRFIPERTP